MPLILQIINENLVILKRVCPGPVAEFCKEKFTGSSPANKKKQTSN